VGMGSSGVKITADAFVIRSQKFAHQIRFGALKRVVVFARKEDTGTAQDDKNP